jgi:hypothetical protein
VVNIISEAISVWPGIVAVLEGTLGSNDFFNIPLILFKKYIKLINYPYRLPLDFFYFFLQILALPLVRGMKYFVTGQYWCTVSGLPLYIYIYIIEHK